MPISAIDDYSEGRWKDVLKIISEAIQAIEYEPKLVSEADVSGVITRSSANSPGRGITEQKIHLGNSVELFKQTEPPLLSPNIFKRTPPKTGDYLVKSPK
jgi:hypothetical protein